jgi:hypothetical protein
MQTKIVNPYDEENTNTTSMYFPINKNAFDQGVTAATKAFAPKKFADELPEEGQRIIMLSKDTSLNAGKFDSVYLVGSKHYSHAKYTHWLPYPELT